jgi:hypothetical protein
MQQAQPQKHIVYRSQAEQISDEFWWSEGYLTATMAGDGILVAAVLVMGLLGYARLAERWRLWKRSGRRG